MEYSEVYEKLRSRALALHRFFVEQLIYQKPLAEAEFLVQNQKYVERIAEGIASGRLDPWVNVLGFNNGLLHAVRSNTYLSDFDTMDRLEAFYSVLQDVLSQAGYQFTWEFDGESQEIRFGVQDVQWAVRCTDLASVDEPISHSKIEPHLTDFLEEEGWYLYATSGGDSWLTYILVPYGAKDALSEYLIPSHGRLHPDFDPRVEWLFTGVPEEERPENVWDL